MCDENKSLNFKINKMSIILASKVAGAMSVENCEENGWTDDTTN
jgi:hypothetical protein